ncbi:MAG: DUF3047 domain-containing protein [Verrucomicrobia bacterium]|nr:DUF3047 domain-containing protein [Deltaproteobacteria bacterium]
MKLSVLLIIVIICMNTIAQADTIAVSRFATEGIAGWDAKSFKGMTEYSLVQESGRTVVKAHSVGSASGLFKKVKLDPARFRYLRWSWKIAATITNGNEKTKGGDDYAARVYVVFPGRFFWQTKAINYIWANRLAKGAHIPNAFTANAMMLAVESGSEKLGTWVMEERDVLADYRRLFAEEPREIGAIAIMTDTDNTGNEATAWYGDISISSTR